MINDIKKGILFFEGTIYYQIVTSLLLIFLLWIVERIVQKVIEKKISDYSKRYTWKKTTTYISVFIGIALVGKIWFDGFRSIATYFGLLSAGLAIALKDPLANLAGWVYLMWRRPFHVGNRIQIGELAGDVIDIRPFNFSILEINNWVKADQSTGRIIHIPNGQVFTLPVANYDTGFKYIWNEISILITFESDWKKAKSILQTIANEETLKFSEQMEKEIKEAARRFLIFYNTLTPTVYTSVEASGVLLTIRHLTEIRKRRGVNQAIWEKVLDNFAQHEDINLAYPTMRRVDK